MDDTNFFSSTTFYGEYRKIDKIAFLSATENGINFPATFNKAICKDGEIIIEMVSPYPKNVTIHAHYLKHKTKVESVNEDVYITTPIVLDDKITKFQFTYFEYMDFSGDTENIELNNVIVEKYIKIENMNNLKSITINNAYLHDIDVFIDKCESLRLIQTKALNITTHDNIVYINNTPTYYALVSHEDDIYNIIPPEVIPSPIFLQDTINSENTIVSKTIFEANKAVEFTITNDNIKSDSLVLITIQTNNSDIEKVIRMDDKTITVTLDDEEMKNVSHIRSINIQTLLVDLRIKDCKTIKTVPFIIDPTSMPETVELHNVYEDMHLLVTNVESKSIKSWSTSFSNNILTITIEYKKPIEMDSIVITGTLNVQLVSFSITITCQHESTTTTVEDYFIPN